MKITRSKSAGAGVKGGAKDAAAQVSGTARDAAGNVGDSVEAVRQAARNASGGQGVEARVTGGGGRGAQTGAQVGAQIGAVAGTVVEEVARRAGEAAGSVAEGWSVVRSRVQDADPGALVRQIGETLEGVVEDGRLRATALAQPQSRVPAKRSSASSWPWAVAASVAGAAAGVAVVLVVRRLLSHDVPGAQEPEQLRAVVDPTPSVATPGAAATGGTVGTGAPLSDGALPPTSPLATAAPRPDAEL